MKVIVAKTAGFCWGVKRAMDAVLEASNSGQEYVQTLGPLIHNPQALELIGKRGVAVAESPDKVENGTVVIRAHGIPIQDLRGLKERQKAGEIKIVNATCPEVAKVHNKIKKWSPKGYFTVILGHCNVLMDLIRASEEIDYQHNDDVLMLNFTLSRGRLPG